MRLRVGHRPMPPATMSTSWPRSLVEVEAVPQRATHVDRLALVQLGDRAGHAPDGAHHQVEGVLARRRAGEADRDLAVAEERELDDLAGLVLHRLPVGHLQREVRLRRSRLHAAHDRGLTGQEDVLDFCPVALVIHLVAPHEAMI